MFGFDLIIVQIRYLSIAIAETDYNFHLLM
jgi:hypothetical protein